MVSMHRGGKSFTPWGTADFHSAALRIGRPNTPAQKTSNVTPHGISTLIITPTATKASGKALQIPLIRLTLVVN
jgi:hypothetical protein